MIVPFANVHVYVALAPALATVAWFPVEPVQTVSGMVIWAAGAVPIATVAVSLADRAQVFVTFTVS